jgi:NDP-4-keto-2,6-dideoxyhexose 3-C-methyltransferase
VVTEKTACRVCGTKFSGKILLDLGNQAIVDFIWEGEGRGSAPLQLVQCVACKLVQLRHTVDPDTLYRKFFYRSSVNEQMREALKELVNDAMDRVAWNHTDVFCDIGSNDGELLLNYPNDILKIGFEPAKELALESSRRLQIRHDEAFEIVNGYFNAVEALGYVGEKKYKIVTAIAMFYDLDDPISFLVDVHSILAPDGIFVVQMNYLSSMMRNLAFDNIGHEHLCYYSLTVLRAMFEKIGLEIFDASLNEVNGGSIRVYAAHKGRYPVESYVSELLLAESVQLSEMALKHFADRTETVAKLLFTFLKDVKRAGKRVYAYGASTRGFTLLQTIFRDQKATDYISVAVERDDRKFGKKMAGLGIPIISESSVRDTEYMLVLPYHFWKSIQKREHAWMKAGGKFILPLPYPKVVALERIGLISYDLEEELGVLKV